MAAKGEGYGIFQPDLVIWPPLWWLERINSTQITCSIFPVDNKDYFTGKGGWGKSMLSSKITVHSPLQVPSEDQKFWRRQKVHEIGLTAKSQRKLEPKITEVSSGFLRGISERLQPIINYKLEPPNTKNSSGQLGNNEEFLKELFSKMLCQVGLLAALSPVYKQLWWQWFLSSGLKSKN